MRVALVTPSLNQAAYLGAAVDSVLGQTYADIDYLVVDGGSRDGSQDVLRSYGDRVRWISEADEGQSDAIDKGLRMTGGEILGWLNADDRLEETAIERVVEAFRAAPEAGLVYGDGVLLDETGHVSGPYVGIEPFNLWRLLYGLDYILQPAAFFRRSAYDAAGGLDPTLHWAMDWDLWIRLAAVAEVEYLPGTLASSRVWGDTKTATGGWRRLRELRSVTRRHTGQAWTPGIRLYALDTLRTRMAAHGSGWMRSMTDAFIGRVEPRIVTRMACYADGWLGPDGCLVLPRRWRCARLSLDVLQVPDQGALILKVSADGRLLHELSIDEAGPLQLSLEIPAREDSPFCTVDLVSSYWFQTPEDRRRLAVRVLDVRRV